MIKLEGQKIITNYPIIYKLGNTFRFRLISLPFNNLKMTAKLIIKPLINRRRKKEKENKLLKEKKKDKRKQKARKHPIQFSANSLR